ncbi:MAG TPA: spore coat protein, partial [Sediminispirochaeta sp.]|nr:spore coat protein [Sediminispirochaeta sp.]
MIDAAAESGAHCVKFQWVIADEIVHRRAGEIELPGGKTAIWDRFHQLERERDFYVRLKEHSEKRGLQFLCSPFGVKSAAELLTLSPQAVKVASPELNHYPLLESLMGHPLFLSTGVSKLGDIEMALDYLRSNRRHEDGQEVLLHCITSYPAPEEEYNLRLLPLLADLFDVSVGVSDHSEHPSLVPLLAVSRGARVVEKHFCLSRSGTGLDDPIALEPPRFAELSRRIAEAEKRTLTEIEQWCRGEFGDLRVERVLGDGRKRLAPSEAPFYHRTKRSIVALQNLEAGQRISQRNVALLRSEQQRPAGLPPRYWDTVMGAVLRKGVKAAHGLRWEHLL